MAGLSIIPTLISYLNCLNVADTPRPGVRQRPKGSPKAPSWPDENIPDISPPSQIVDIDLARLIPQSEPFGPSEHMVWLPFPCRLQRIIGQQSGGV